jgi:hypothetical protein
MNETAILRAKIPARRLQRAEKSRPVLILAYPRSDDARSLLIVARLMSANLRTTRRGAARQTALVAEGVGGQRAGVGQF